MQFFGSRFRSLLIAGCILAGMAQAGTRRCWVDAQAQRLHHQRSLLGKIARQSMAAVVSITTTPDDNEEKDEPQKGLGSGFVIHHDGYILTSSHVVEHAADIRVSLWSHGYFHELPARVIGKDEQTDTALIKVEPPAPLPVLKLSTARNVDIGDWVMVIGNPFGLSHSVSVGVVSFKGRDDVTPAGRNGYFDYLQTDAAINPGNSGGPVLDLHGNVVAIANAVNVAGQGIGFAVPIDIARQVLPQLLVAGEVKRGWLGISVEDVEPRLGARRPHGRIRVSDIARESPAARAGLHVGDMILGLNQHSVRGAHALRWKVATAGVGHWVELFVSRDGQPLHLRARLEPTPVSSTRDSDVDTEESSPKSASGR